MQSGPPKVKQALGILPWIEQGPKPSCLLGIERIDGHVFPSEYHKKGREYQVPDESFCLGYPISSSPQAIERRQL